MSATTLSGNSAGQGGAISSSGTLTVGGSTFSGNAASQGGALADVNGVDDVVTDTTFATNSATDQGGAVYASLSALALINTTVAYNLVAIGGTGGGLDVADGSVTLYNTIVDLNNGLGATDVAGTVVGTNNLISVANPGLAGGLADNGGPTQTIALLAASPAIDAGVNSVAGYTVPATDQRGAIRGAVSDAVYVYAGNTADIGAFEASSGYRVATAADSNDLGTLRTAVSWANVSVNNNPAALALTTAPANTVDFDTAGAFASPRTIGLSSDLGTLVLSNTATPVAIDGPGSAAVTISGGGTVGVFQVNSGVNADLSDLTITGGSAATGGGINNAGTLTLAGSTVEANAAAGAGGGINNVGTLTLAGTAITGNSAGSSGGGINNPGILTLSAGATISGNSATGSGGGIADAGTLTLTSIAISGNTAGIGGGVVVGGTLTDTASTISGNSASTSGGGIAVRAGGVASLTGSTVSGNTAGTVGGVAPGGGIDNAGA